MAPTHHLPIAQEIMTTRLVTVEPGQPIFTAIRTLLRHKISGAPVVTKAGELVGMLSELDCLKVLANGEFHDAGPSEEGTVRDYMSPGTRSVPPDADVYVLAQHFHERSLRRLPVVKDGVLLGQISRRDVLRTIEEMSRKRLPRKRYPDYREPVEYSQSTSHLHHR